MRGILILALAGLALGLPGRASAYPQFEAQIEKMSGRNVDCSFCHANPDGPDGVKAGQIGSLDAAGLKALNKARTAFEPGAGIDSPILNDFGDHLVNTLGKKKILALRQSPEKIPELLGDSDLDGDGISDADEFRDGTHPLVAHHGDPWKLLAVNLQKNGFRILMLILSTVFGLFGINHLLTWFGIEARQVFGDAADEQAAAQESEKH